MTVSDDNRRPIRVIPLGGFGEVGMNCMLLQCGERLLMVDCGVKFCAEPRLGLDCYRPSFAWLEDRAHLLEAIVLTHGHEDHIAAIPHLPGSIRTTVYGGPFTLGLVRARLAECRDTERFALQPVHPATSVQTPSFHIRVLPVAHSIVDSYSYLVTAGTQRILITGDYRIDTPPDGAQTSNPHWTAAGPGPVDLMIGDSTGALEEGDSGDESRLSQAMARVFAQTEGRIYVALFSSNIARIHRIIDLAVAAERAVAFAGRSVETHMAIAAAAGRTSPIHCRRVAVRDIDSLPRNGGLVFVSGTQGEPRSVLHRLAVGAHAHLDVRRGDAVILSSRIIPGNELAVGAMVDQLLISGAAVYHPATHPELHVSGHGTSREIRAAIEGVSPCAYLPAHGTYAHMVAAARIAEECGVVHTDVIRNGDAATWSDSGLTVLTGGIPARRVAMAGGRTVDEAVLKERAALSNGGCLFIELAMPSAGSSTGPAISQWRSWGAFDSKLEMEIRDHVATRIEAWAKTDNSREPAALDTLRNRLRRFIQKEWGVEPFVTLSSVTKSD